MPSSRSAGIDDFWTGVFSEDGLRAARMGATVGEDEGLAEVRRLGLKDFEVTLTGAVNAVERDILMSENAAGRGTGFVEITGRADLNMIKDYGSAAEAVYKHGHPFSEQGEHICRSVVRSVHIYFRIDNPCRGPI